VLWGIQYIVCMCIIIIDITDIINDCMGTSRVFGGGVGSDNSLYMEGGVCG
jgi:hypothetical protein